MSILEIPINRGSYYVIIIKAKKIFLPYIYLKINKYYLPKKINLIKAVSQWKISLYQKPEGCFLYLLFFSFLNLPPKLKMLMCHTIMYSTNVNIATFQLVQSKLETAKKPGKFKMSIPASNVTGLCSCRTTATPPGWECSIFKNKQNTVVVL